MEKAKLASLIVAAAIGLSSTVPNVLAEETPPSSPGQESAPASITLDAGAPSGVSDYKVYDTGVNPDARVEFIDPKLAQNNKISPQAGERRVYVKSEYAVGALKIAGYNVGPISNQTFLVSVAKGHTAQTTRNITVSGTLQVQGSFDVNVLKLVKESLNLSVSGTVSKTYTTSDTWSGPPESSSYNTRDYYGAINYDLYNITVVK